MHGPGAGIEYWLPFRKLHCLLIRFLSAFSLVYYLPVMGIWHFEEPYQYKYTGWRICSLSFMLRMFPVARVDKLSAVLKVQRVEVLDFWP